MTDTIVCERIYQAGAGDHVEPLRLLFFLPKPGAVDWSCRFRIETKTGKTRERDVFGLDSLQALVLAMQAAASELLAWEKPVFQFAADDDLMLPTCQSLSEDVSARRARYEGRA